MAAERGDQDVGRTRVRELDGAFPVEDGFAHAAVDAGGADRRRHRLRSVVDALGTLHSRSTHESQKAMSLDRGLADQDRRRRRRTRELRVVEKLLFRQLSHPAKERPRAAASDQDLVVVEQELSDEVLITGRCCVLGGLDDKTARAEPLSRPPMNPAGRIRFSSCKLERGEFGEK
jgi:hypothetical protein